MRRGLKSLKATLFTQRSMSTLQHLIKMTLSQRPSELLKCMDKTMSKRGGLKCHSAVSGKEFLFWTKYNVNHSEPQESEGKTLDSSNEDGEKHHKPSLLLLFNLKRSISLGNESRSKTTSKILQMG